MPNKLLRRQPGEAPRTGGSDQVAYHHNCDDCDWQEEGGPRGTSGCTLAYEHAKRFDHRTTMIVTRYYEYEGKYA
jgi:hypothetical protein